MISDVLSEHLVGHGQAVAGHPSDVKGKLHYGLILTSKELVVGAAVQHKGLDGAEGLDAGHRAKLAKELDFSKESRCRELCEGSLAPIGGCFSDPYAATGDDVEGRGCQLPLGDDLHSRFKLDRLQNVDETDQRFDGDTLKIGQFE